MKNKKILSNIPDVFGVLAAFFVFIIPFLFMLINSLKDRREANKLSLALPSSFHWENHITVFTHNNNLLLTAFKNSFLLTLGSVIVMVITCAMAGYVLQRRRDKVMSVFNALVMAGLMIPPAILPTITLMQTLHVYKTMFGMILIEVALQTPFTVMLYRGFIGTIPIELEEAGYIDGCGRWRMFGSIIFPLLKPVLFLILVLRTIDCVRLYDAVAVLTQGGPGTSTETMTFYLYRTGLKLFRMDYASTMAVFFLYVMLVASIFALKPLPKQFTDRAGEA